MTHEREIHGTRHICLNPARHNGEIIPDVPLNPFLFECSLQMADPKMGSLFSTGVNGLVPP